MGANISCCDESEGFVCVADHPQHVKSQRHAVPSLVCPLTGFGPLLHTTTPCEIGGAGSTSRVDERGNPSISGGMCRSSAMASSARLTASDIMTTVDGQPLRMPSPGEEGASFLVAADTSTFTVTAEEQQRVPAATAEPAPITAVPLHAPMARIASGSSSVPTTTTTTTATATANTSSSQPTVVTQNSTPRLGLMRAFVSVVDSMELIDDQLEKRTSKQALANRVDEPVMIFDDRTSFFVTEFDLPMSAFSPETSFT
jgi:hypothetical protein